MKNRFFRAYFALMLILIALVSMESRGLTYDKNSEDGGSILRKPEERYPIDPDESPQGKKIIKRTYRSRTLC